MDDVEAERRRGLHDPISFTLSDREKDMKRRFLYSLPFAILAGCSASGPAPESVRAQSSAATTAVARVTLVKHALTDASDSPVVYAAELIQASGAPKLVFLDG